MQQVSLPIRIALVAMLAFAALWFVALRPGEEEAPEPLAGEVPAAVAPKASTPATEPAAAPAQAAAEPAAATTAPATKTSSGTATSSKDLAAPLVRDLRAGRAVVVLFAAKGADDRAARRAVAAVDRRGGRVRVEVAAIGDVARYEQITTGVQVTQAPTTLVIGPDREAQAITGYTDASEVEQAVGDALARVK